MSALDDLHKLGDFPAVRRCYEKEYVTDDMWEDALEELAEELVEMSKALDAAISDAKYFERERDELADKLAKSIEWARIEQRRKQEAEEHAERAERERDEARRKRRETQRGRSEAVLPSANRRRGARVAAQHQFERRDGGGL